MYTLAPKVFAPVRVCQEQDRDSTWRFVGYADLDDRPRSFGNIRAVLHDALAHPEQATHQGFQVELAEDEHGNRVGYLVCFD